MDAFAKALITADAIIRESDFMKLRKERYASFDSGRGKEFEQGLLTLEDLEKLAQDFGEPDLISGKQELFENIINQYL